MEEVCPYCATEMPDGASICRGCGAELVIGASRREQESAGKWGAALGFVAYLSLLNDVRWLEFTFLHIGGALVLGYLAGVAVAIAMNKHQVRFFRTSRRY